MFDTLTGHHVSKKFGTAQMGPHQLTIEVMRKDNGKDIDVHRQLYVYVRCEAENKSSMASMFAPIDITNTVIELIDIAYRKLYNEIYDATIGKMAPSIIASLSERLRYSIVQEGDPKKGMYLLWSSQWHLKLDDKWQD